jgi:antitoxin component YwqK of YwqJK toxin-antitoxin module
VHGRCWKINVIKLKNKTRGYIMNNKYLLIIFIFLIISCADQKKAQTTSTGNNIEVKFLVLKSGENAEYKLIYQSGTKVIATRVYKNGQTIFSEGVIPNSQVIEKYKNGKIKNIMHYKNGKREGKAIGFYQNGNIKILVTYKNDNPAGIIKTFYNTGQLRSESKIVDGEKVFYKEYYKNGKIKEEVYYKNGDGISKEYDANGNQIKY